MSGCKRVYRCSSLFAFTCQSNNLQTWTFPAAYCRVLSVYKATLFSLKSLISQSLWRREARIRAGVSTVPCPIQVQSTFLYQILTYLDVPIYNARFISTQKTSHRKLFGVMSGVTWPRGTFVTCDAGRGDVTSARASPRLWRRWSRQWWPLVSVQWGAGCAILSLCLSLLYWHLVAVKQQQHEGGE